MAVESKGAIKVFYSYAHEDKEKRNELEKHLGALRRSGKIVTWYDRDIQAGTSWEQEISNHLSSADLILLLISHHFINSDYCYGVEMMRAIERHQAGEARVIPIILSPVDWEETPIIGLEVLPSGRKPITQWRDRNVAFLNVAQSIREVVKALLVQQEDNQVIAEPNRQTIDTHEAIRLFHQLMQSDLARQFRVLYLVGEAKMGKSHLLAKVFPVVARCKYQARCVLFDLRTHIYSVPDTLNIACDQLDLQNCHNYHTAYQKLIDSSKSNTTRFLADCSYLDASIKVNNDTRTRDDRLTTQLVLDLEKLRDKPLVLFFDSVSNAPEYIQTWLIEIFLAKVSLLPHVRVVIAGRTLPEVPGSYVDLYQLHQLHPIVEEAEYIAYCQSIYPNLAEHSIRSIIHSCCYIPGIFVDYLFTELAQQRI